MSTIEEISSYDRVRSKAEYEHFYTKSDFRHFGLADKFFIQTLVKRYQLKEKFLIDTGSGTGWYSYLFSLCGVRTYSVELSEAGTFVAKGKYNLRSCLVGDGLALPFPFNSFDVIFCSGFPPFNAEDLSTLSTMGHNLFAYLKSGGLFIFHKTTDLTGSKGSRMNHSLATFEQYFRDIGEGPIVDSFTVSPIFWITLGSLTLTPTSNKLSQVFTKLTKLPLRALIIVRKRNDS